MAESDKDVIGWDTPEKEDEVERVLKNIRASGVGEKSRSGTMAAGRLGYRQPIDNSSEIEAGVSGHYAKGKTFKDVAADKADVSYRKRFSNDSELRATLGANLNERAGKRGIDSIGIEYEIPFKKGGKVKSKVSKASKRADGCCVRGKTKGRVV